MLVRSGVSFSGELGNFGHLVANLFTSLILLASLLIKYPTDFMRKIILILFLLGLPILTQAISININTASLDELDQITGVGPAIAGKIIDYRNTIGLFKTIEEIKNVSGIGDATFLKMKDQITVDGSNSTVSSNSSNSNNLTNNQTVDNEGANAEDSAHTGDSDISDYTKDTFKIGAGRERLATVRTPILFLASQNKRGKTTNAFNWSFGDGTSAMGDKVYHTYQFPGQYNVVLNGSIDDQEEAVARTKVIVTEAKIKITAIDLSAGYIEITNNSDKEQNLNGWILKSGEGKYVFPVDTIISPKSVIKIPLNLVGLSDKNVKEISLAYPDGGVVSGASLQTGADQQKLAELKKQISKLKQEINRQATSEGGDKNLGLKEEQQLAEIRQNVVVLKKEPNWFEKIKNAIFQ